MKKFFVSHLCMPVVLLWHVLLLPTADAQVLGNEWITPGQSYFKIPVAKTGMYAVTFAQLTAGGVPATFTSTPANMQLFHRGEEQAIHISNDTLFFYGQMNDGTLDSLLYRPNVNNPLVSSQPHKYYNLYSDTTAYFLTWSAGAAGKRMVISNLIGAVSPEAYHNAETLTLFTDHYNSGFGYQSTYLTTGDQGEGWFGGTAYFDPRNGPHPVDYSYTFNPVAVYSSGPQANLEVMLVGTNGLSKDNLIHKVDILIGDPANPDMAINVPHFAFHDVKKITFSIPLSSLLSGSLVVTIRNKGNGTDPSSVSLGYMRLTYPQTFNMQGAGEMYINTLNPSLSAIEISNPSSAAKIFDISDKNNLQLVSSVVQSGLLKATLSASASGHKLYVVQPDAYLTIPSIKEVNLNLFSNLTTAEYIIITNKKIITGAREYASYRASSQGGAYDTLLADVDQLYNIYSYGERTPVGIKRFVSHLLSVGAPGYLFIIGKGLSANYPSSAPYYRKSPLTYIHHSNPDRRREDLIPCFGVPCSDLLYSMSLDGSSTQFVAKIPTGRLSAKTDQEVRNYLAKIVEHETLNVKAPWRKHLIHLSGGDNSFQMEEFKNYMGELKGYAEDTLFGGKVVKIFSKKGNDAVDNELTTSVAKEINKGVSYVTFLGHSSPGVMDLDIGFVSIDIYDYHNKGMYPMLFINGCSSAQMFSRWSFAEDWILTPERGAIITLGHTDLGLSNQMKNYARIYYKNAFQTRALLGKPVGDIQIATIEDFNAAYGTFSEEVVATTQQMVIQGDPGVRIYTPELPDYQIDDSKLSIQSLDDQVVTAVSGSFAIAIVVSNLGVDFKDSLEVSVRRKYNGKVFNYGPVKYKNVSYMDTILFEIQSPDIAAYGQNDFLVTLDPLDSIPEIDELNNTATLRYFMPLSGVTALFPKEYSIVSNGVVTLVAQSTNLLVANRNYFVEIDTTYLFNSTVRKDTIINSGSLVKWKNLVLPVIQDSLVYYWRVRYNDLAITDDTLWGESSFIYIGGSMPGWSQSEFPQFFKDPLTKVERNIPQREWEFGKPGTSILVEVVGTSYPVVAPLSTPAERTRITINGFNYEFRGFCYGSGNSLFAMAFDKITSAPYSPYPNSEGGYTCGNYSMNAINFFYDLSDGTSPPAFGTSTEQNQANLAAYIDSVPTGDYVIVGNNGNAYYNNWTTALKDKIKTELGAKYIDNLSDGMPYLLVTKKGATDPIFEAYDTQLNTLISFDSTIYGTHTNGYISSTLIGPADEWGTFYRKVSLPDATDKYEMKIIGVDILGNHIDTLSIPQHDTLDLTTVAISQYPYIRLLAEIKDTANLTAPQLKRWQVIYSGVPEGTMNPALVGVSQYNPVSKPEGDSITLCYAFENISNLDFDDTLQVKYTITNSITGAHVTMAKLTKLKVDSVVTFCHTFNTKGYQGSNVFQAFVNPKILKEEYYNNNIIEMAFNVEKDNIHPILDVVFDGIHIMDGDIVSPSPLITLTLKDDNKFFIRNTTEDIELFLQKPGDAVPLLVNMAGPDIIAAKQVGSNGKNVYQIEYHPKNFANGIYTLVARGKDLSENASGVEDYRISFEVINESTITNFYPYPNPFSTSTRFVFTLTGSEIPSDMKIQIMTVTGKVVREITKAELGHIRIGNNKTEFAWDGTDEFGDKLANGVYLYRVILKDGSDFKHRESAGDRSFKKNFGKLYILR